MIDIVDRLRFDEIRCEAQFSKGVASNIETAITEIERLRRCITMAMGCISPVSEHIDERLAWYRLLDAIEGREPRRSVSVAQASREAEA